MRMTGAKRGEPPRTSRIRRSSRSALYITTSTAPVTIMMPEMKSISGPPLISGIPKASCITLVGSAQKTVSANPKRV